MFMPSDEEERLKKLQDAYNLYVRVQEKGQKDSYFYPDYELGRNDSINQYANNYQKMLMPKEDPFKPASTVNPSLSALQDTRYTSTIPDYYKSFTGRDLASDVDTGVSKIGQLIKDIPIPLGTPNVGGAEFGNTTIGKASIAPLQAVNKALLGIPEAMGNYALPKTMNMLKGVQETAPVEDFIGQGIGYVAPFAAASKLATPLTSFIPNQIAKLAATEGLAGAGVGAAEGVVAGENAGEVLDRATTYGAFGALGGAGVGAVGKGLNALKLRRLADAGSITDKDLSSYMINRQSQMYKDGMYTPDIEQVSTPMLEQAPAPIFPRLNEGTGSYSGVKKIYPFIKEDPKMLPATGQGYQLTGGSDNYGQMVTDPRITESFLEAKRKSWLDSIFGNKDKELKMLPATPRGYLATSGSDNNGWMVTDPEVTRKMKGMYSALQMRPVGLGDDGMQGVMNYDPETTLKPRVDKRLVVDVPLDLQNRQQVIEVLKNLTPNEQIVYLKALLGRSANFNKVDVSGGIENPTSVSDVIPNTQAVAPPFQSNNVPPFPQMANDISQQVVPPAQPVTNPEPPVPPITNIALDGSGNVSGDPYNPLSNPLVSKFNNPLSSKLNTDPLLLSKNASLSPDPSSFQAGDRVKGTYSKIDSEPLDRTLNLSDVVPDEALPSITPEKLNDYLRIRNEVLSGEPQKKYRMWVKNSIITGEVTHPETRAYWLENMPRLTSISNEETYGRAWEAVANDLEGSITKFSSMDHFTSADDVALGEAITVKLMHDGDLVRANEIIASFAERATLAGQIMQAMSMYKKLSPMGVINFAEKVIKQSNEITTSYKVGFKTIEKNGTKTVVSGSEAANSIPTKSQVPAGNKLPKGLNVSQNTLQALSEADRAEIIRIKSEFDSLPENLRKGDQGDVLITQISSIISGYLKPDLVDMVLSLQRINLLFNLKTMTRNVVGNLINAPVAQASQAVSAVLDSAISKTFGTPRTTFAPTFPFNSLRVGRDKVTRDLMQGIDTSPIATQYELQIGRPDAFRDLWLDNYGKGNNLISKQINSLKWTIGETLRNADKFTKAGLKYGDRPFYEYHRDSVIEGYQKWAKKQMGFDGDHTQLVPPQEFMDLADLIAKQRTFQDLNRTTEALKGAKEAMNNFLGAEISRGGKSVSLGIGNVNLPFTMTGANLLRTGLQNTLAGTGTVFKQLWNASTRNGKFDQYKLVKALGDNFTGYGSLLFGAWLVKQGLVSGDVPSDKDAREFSLGQNTTPAYSIQLGGKRYTFDWMQPIAIPVAIGVDIMQSIENGSLESKGAGTVAWDAVNSGFTTLIRQSLLQSIYKMFGGSVTQGNSDAVSNITNTALSAGTQFVPFGSTTKPIAETYDYFKNGNIKRNANSPNVIMDKLINPIKNMTFARETLPPKLDAWGNPVPLNDTGWAPTDLLQSFILPMRVSTSKNNKVDLELQRLYDDAGETAQFPRYAKNEIKVKENGKTKDVSLTEEERNAYQIEFGKIAKPRVEALVNNSLYKKAKDEVKVQMISRIYSDADAQLKRQILMSQKGK